MIQLFNNPLILISVSSILFGFFTKLADLTNEHKRHFFRGDKIIFGILYGIFGSLTILQDELLGAFYLAIILHWIIRKKIDYPNHILAVVIITVSFFSYSNLAKFELAFFSITLILFLLSGLLKDKKIIRKTYFTDFNIYAFIFIILLIFFNREYTIVLISYLLNTLFYSLAKKV